MSALLEVQNLEKQLDRHHAVPLLDGDVLNVVGTSDSGVVDENIYAAQRRDATFATSRATCSGSLTSAWMALPAIVAFTRCLALEIGTRNVNANCVAPGATRTALIADIADDLMQKIRASIPKGRLGEVDDIVPSYVFLASDEARFYQGQCISPNGGDIFL